MDVFKNLLGGDDKHSEHEDFINRFEKGAPWEGISDEEAQDRHQQVAQNVSPEMYEESAEEALNRMSPQQRQEFGGILNERAQEQGISLPGLGNLGNLADSRQLAQVMGMMQRQQPGMLGMLLGGGGMAGGIGAMAASKLGRNPLEKAALAGIAAMATKKMMGR